MKLGTITLVEDHNADYISVTYSKKDNVIFFTLIEKSQFKERFSMNKTLQYLYPWRDQIAKAHGLELNSAEVHPIIQEIGHRIAMHARKLAWFQVYKVMES
jgi:hypothetical protein